MIRKAYLLSRIEQLEDRTNDLREDLRAARRTNKQLRFVLDELAKHHGWSVRWREEGFHLTPLPKKEDSDE